jgi:hypothetical protein
VIHFFGGPITPETCAYEAWRGGHACVSFAEPRQIELAAAICQTFMLDNGAFTRWKQGKETDWQGYYRWCEKWLAHPACDWAVIPDVIGGTEPENDALLKKWPFGPHRGVPVWHLNESPERLVRLAGEWPRVALGSAAEWDASVPSKCLERLCDVLPAICPDGQPVVKLHGLRMLSHHFVASVPMASADSTNLARNIGLDGNWASGVYLPATKETRARVLRERIESHQAPARLNEVIARRQRAKRDQGLLWDEEAS